MREFGFYWVKYCGTWEVARAWAKTSTGEWRWDVLGIEESVQDDYFEEIGEQILRSSSAGRTADR